MTQHLRNDIPRPLHDHRVADADIFPGDLILVVQRGVRHHDTTDRDRLQPRHRRQGTRTADLDVDAFENCRGLFGRELVSQAPARAARDKSQPLLPVKPVHLVDDAIDVIAQIGALALDQPVMAKQLSDAAAQPHQWIGGQAPGGKGFDDAHLRGGRKQRGLAPGISEKLQRTRRGDRRIELPQRARGGIARIGEELAAQLILFLIQA